MNVAFRVDASPEIGIGHLMRCLCLADALHGRGARVRLIGRIGDDVREALAGRAFELVCLDRGRSRAAGGARNPPHSQWLGTTQAADAEESVAALGGGSWDWLVVDHYALDSQWEALLRPHVSRVLAIDDLADRAHDCDVLLDQNLHAEAERRYDGKVPRHCRVLSGPRHALLREEFRDVRSQVTARTGPVGRVLVSFGGSDVGNLTALAIEALVACGTLVPAVDVVVGALHPDRDGIESACRHAGFHCHAQPSRMSELMAAADVAIGAGGVTAWERCCMGLPALTLAAAPNQTAMVAEAALHGLLYTPAEGPVSAASLAVHIRALVDNPRLREFLSRNGMAAVDGQGVWRVLRVMDRDSIRVREATVDDTDALFEWRNHESVRIFMRRTEPIARADHQAWLAAVLADPERFLLIGDRHGTPAGVVRFDITGEHAEVSTYLVPGRREPGLGSMLQVAAEEWLAARRPEVTTVVAEVLEGNEPSHGFLRATGYRKRVTVYEKRIQSR